MQSSVRHDSITYVSSATRANSARKRVFSDFNLLALASASSWSFSATVSLASMSAIRRNVAVSVG